MATIYEKKKEYGVYFSEEKQMLIPFIIQRSSLTYCIAIDEFWFCDKTDFGQPHLADVIFIGGERIIAYELKLRDWKKVLDQAVVNAKNFTFSGICMLDKTLQNSYSKMEKVCKEYNIEVVSLVFNNENLKYRVDFNDRFMGQTVKNYNLNFCYNLNYYNRLNFHKPNKEVDPKIIEKSKNLIPKAINHHSGIKIIDQHWIPWSF